jgi:hypothetical protein
MKPRRVIVCSLIEIRDDPPAAGPQHSRHDLAGDPERSGRLGLQDVAEAARRYLPERLRLGHEPRVDRAHPDPGVVDQDVQAAEHLAGAVNRRGRRTRIPHVELDPHRSSAQLLGGDMCPFSSRPVTATCAPARTSAWAIARPRPLVPPVTSTRVSLTCAIDGQLPQ